MIYRSSQLLMRGMAHLFWGLKVEGLERVPREGPYILAVSHESFIDPPLVGAIAPAMWFLARGTLFLREDGSRKRIASFFGRAYNIVEMDREAGGREGLRIALEQLGAGHGLLMFPEGTRSPDGSVQEFRPGVGMLALKTGAPVVPCSVEGTHRAWGRGRKRPRILFARRGGPIRVRFGEKTVYQRPAKARDVAADIRRRVVALRNDGRTEPAPGKHGGGGARSPVAAPHSEGRPEEPSS